MNEQQAVAVRDPRDPFSQALSLLFKEAQNPRELKEKYRKELTPLVTQVALKIGAIDTEKAIAERAIPVFVGTIGIFLMKETGGAYNAEKWRTLISSCPIAHLFREGYTLVHDIIKKRWRLEVRVGEQSVFYETAIERMVVFATYRVDGMWAGYALYADEADGVAQESTRRAFAEWLMHNFQGRTVAREAAEKVFSEPDEMDTGDIIRRALYHVFDTGKPSLKMDFRRARDLVHRARKSTDWLVKAEGRFNAFVETLPSHFRNAFSTPVKKETPEERGLHGEMESVWHNLQWICRKRTNALEAIDEVCVNTGIQPPILGKKAKKILG